MQPFVTHRGKTAVLDWTDVNTDLIIPARYLKRIERTGYGPLLFADKRYAPGSAPEADDPERHGPLAPDFPLNAPEAQGADVLVVGRNFGCGSSREHAVWAVHQAGFRALIAPGRGEGFADIFEQNALNNGLLPIELDEADWNQIVQVSRAPGGAEVVIDLERQSVALETPAGTAGMFPFVIPEGSRRRLLRGLDAIGETLLHDAQIRDHERGMPTWMLSTLS